MSREFGAGTDGGTSAPESGAGPPGNEHPTPEELLAFHFGALEAVDRDRVEDHLSRCPDCAQVVLDFAAFPELEPVGEMTPEQQRALAAQRRRLRELARDESLSEAGTGTAKVIPGPWRGRLRTAWAVAAVFFVATVGLSLWIAGTSFDRGRVLAPSLVRYVSSDTSIQRSETESVEIPATEERTVLHMRVNPGLRDFPEYRVDLLDASGERVWSGREFHLDEEGVLSLLVDGRWQPPGRYTFEIYGLGRDEPREAGRLPVEIVARSDEMAPTEG